MTTDRGKRKPLRRRHASRRKRGRLRPPRALSEPDRQREMERARLGRQGQQAEACRELWIAVIQQAVRDLLWLERNGWLEDDGQPAEGPSAQYEEILSYDPVSFLRSRRFDDICRLIDLPPFLVRELLDVDEILVRVAA